MPPVVSFIIPVRNDAGRLRRCLETVRACTDGVPAEIIVADNGSTDASARVANEAGAEVLAIPGVRVADVRNQAAAVARGEFLAFVDADHELAPGWTEAAMKAIRTPSVVAVGSQYQAPPNGTWVQRIYDRLRDHQPGNRVVGWLPSGNLVIRRAAFARVGGFDATLETCEDVDLCQRLTRDGRVVMAVEGMRSIHHGDPATLAALFAGELWRGRDNLRVTLRAPLTRQSVPSAAAPLVTLGALAALLAGVLVLPVGVWWLAASGLAWILVLTGARAIVLMKRTPPAERTPRTAAQAWLVACVYDVARALALVARSGHAVRRGA